MHQNETEIRATLRDVEAAMRSGDAPGVVAHYAPGVVAFTLAPPLRQDPAQVVDPARLRTWFAGFHGEFDWAITDLDVTCGEDIAFGHSLNHLRATPVGMDQPFDLWFRATYCLRRIDGAWLIAHEHTSTPFYMDGSMRAAVDLVP
jgi:ketosteroid isomerase-like protein